MLPSVHAAVDGFLPDVLVVDHHALAGAAVGHRSGLPWATLVPLSVGLSDPLGDPPAIAHQVRQRAQGFLRDAGLDDISAARVDPQASPHLVVACTTKALSGPVDHRGRLVFVGLCRDVPPDDFPFAWGGLDGRPLVVVTLEAPHWHRGTQVYARAAEAAESLDVQAVAIGPPDLARRTGPRVVVAPRSTLPSLVRSAAAVVCDGGDATVTEALLYGVPLVVMPTIGDQLVLAGQLARAGAAVRLDLDSVTVAKLARALNSVLTDRLLSDGARRVRDSFARAGGAIVAADRLEALLRARPLVRSEKA